VQHRAIYIKEKIEGFQIIMNEYFLRKYIRASELELDYAVWRCLHQEFALVPIQSYFKIP